MGWQVLPSFSLMVGAIAAIPLSQYVINYIFLGNPYLRQINSPDECLHYLRDKRLSGGVSAYDQVGLESIDL